MIARNATPSRAHRFRSKFADDFGGWSLKIVGPKPIRFFIKHKSWPRAALVSAATLHSRRRFMTAVLEQCLVWPSDDLLNDLFGCETQIGWKPGLIGKLIDEAREEFSAEARK